MAGINQIITLGVGNPSDIPHLVLTGLGPSGSEPPDPGPEDPAPGAIQIGVATTILNDATVVPSTGLTFALPAGGTRLSWQTVFVTNPSAVEIDLEISHDMNAWATLDTSTNVNGEIRSLRVNSRFIRARLADGIDDVDVSVKVLVRKEKMK